MAGTALRRVGETAGLVFTCPVVHCRGATVGQYCNRLHKSQYSCWICFLLAFCSVALCIYTLAIGVTAPQRPRAASGPGLLQGLHGHISNYNYKVNRRLFIFFPSNQFSKKKKIYNIVKNIYRKSQILLFN